MSGEALLLNLTELSASVLEEALQAPGGHAARAVVKDGSLRLTVIAFKQGASLNEHKAAGAVSIEVLKGTVTLTAGSRTEEMQERQVLILAAETVHSVVAKTDAAILVTIGLPS